MRQCVEAGAVRQRSGVEIGVALVEPVDIGVIAMAHKKQVAVAQHRALWVCRLSRSCKTARLMSVAAVSAGRTARPALAGRCSHVAGRDDRRQWSRPNARGERGACARFGVATSSRARAIACNVLDFPDMEPGIHRNCAKTRSPAGEQQFRNSAQFSMHSMTRSPGLSRVRRDRLRGKRCGGRIRDSSRRERCR